MLACAALMTAAALVLCAVVLFGGPPSQATAPLVEVRGVLSR